MIYKRKPFPHALRLVSAGLTACLLSSTLLVSSFAANTENRDITAKVTKSSAYLIWIEGEDLPIYQSATDKSSLYPIVYEGTTYIPLRTAALWMGKEIGWDEATQTVQFSGTVDRKYEMAKLELPDGKQYATMVPERTVTVDGATKQFHDALGNVTYPIDYAGTTFLPLRSVGELCGLEAGWDAESKWIFLRTPMTEEQHKQAKAYVAAQVDGAKVIHDTVRETLGTRDPAVHALASDPVHVRANAVKMKETVAKMRSTTPPDVPLFNAGGHAQSLSEALQQTDEVLDDLIASIDRGDSYDTYGEYLGYGDPENGFRGLGLLYQYIDAYPEIISHLYYQKL